MIVEFADLISAVFGLFAAILLGGPALLNLLNKKRWLQMRRLQARLQDDPEGLEQTSVLRDLYLDRLIGASRGEAWVNVIGYGCLIVAFLFLALAAIHRGQALG